MQPISTPTRQLAHRWLSETHEQTSQLEAIAIAALDHEDQTTRLGALRFLKHVNSRAAIPRIQEFVASNDPRFPKKSAMFELLAGEPIPVDVLLQYFADEELSSIAYHIEPRIVDVVDKRVDEAIVAAYDATPKNRASLLELLAARQHIKIDLKPFLHHCLHPDYRPKKVSHRPDWNMARYSMLADLVTSYGDASMREALFDIMRTESKTRPFLHQASYIDADTKLEFLLGQLRRCEERDNDIIDDRVDRRNRWDTILALSKLNDRRAIPHLMDYYRTDGGWVIRCLGYIQDPLAVDILLTVLYGGGQTNRVTLQDCLIGIKHSENPVFGPHLLHWLYLTRKGLMEEDVIRALGATRNPIAVPDLIPLLARDDAYAPHERKPTIADRAAKALTAIGTPEALAAVAAWREQRA